MGFTQILLIVLSVVIVGISIAVGLEMNHQYSVSIHQQMMRVRITEIVAHAMAHRITPVTMGGGGGSFVGFTPGGSTESSQPGASSAGGVMLEEREVNYYIEWYFNDKLKIIASSKIFGEGYYWNNSYNARIECMFDSNGNIDNKGFAVSGDWRN